MARWCLAPDAARAWSTPSCASKRTGAFESFGEDEGAAEPEVPNCVDHELEDGLGTIMTGNNKSAPSGTGTSCGGVGYHEVMFEWRAPAAGTYRIDTRDPDAFDVAPTFDTVLGLRTPGCPGVELARNDDYCRRRVASSKVHVAVSAPQRRCR